MWVDVEGVVSVDQVASVSGSNAGTRHAAGPFFFWSFSGRFLVIDLSKDL